MNNVPTTPRLTDLERADLAIRLEISIGALVDRYCWTSMQQVRARVASPEYARFERAASRQYRALIRLVAALGRLATEVDR